MQRHDIIKTIGVTYLNSNIENGEFSYPKALKAVGKKIDPSLVKSADGTIHEKLDLRFVSESISVLVETKDNYDNYNKANLYGQIQAYVNYEKVLTGNKVVVIQRWLGLFEQFWCVS